MKPFLVREGLFMRKFAVSLLMLVCLFSAAGCVSAGKTLPADIRYTRYTDLSYGPHERNLVDISIPGGISEGLILFIHGGIWMYGGKENHPVFLDVYRNRFTVASMSHRYIDGDIRLNDLEDDVAAAVAYTGDFARRRKGDPGKLIIMGHSSGAHLAMLYAYKQQEAGPIPIAFCVNMAGPSDLSDIAFFYNFKKRRMEKFFYRLAEKAVGYHIADGDITSEGYSEAGRKIMEAVSPICFVSAASPPTIIVHDAADSLVPYSNSAALNSVLNVYGVDHDFLASYSGIGHFLGARIIKRGALVYDKALAVWLTKVMDEYMEKYCK
jgi:acetyl esterase/lipase